MKIESICILIIVSISNVIAFGRVGHEISAAIAQRFLSPKARKYTLELLPKEAEGNLTFIASWADRIKHLPVYRFTSPLHYIDPPDDFPPKHCLFSYKPGKNDIINAINNYTHRLDPKADLGYWPRAEALRFLVHFIGDLHQPLHTTKRDRGGNDSPATFEGHKTSMHAIWDYMIIYKQIRELYANITFDESKGRDFAEDNYFDHHELPQTKPYNGVFYDLYLDHIIKLIKTTWRKEVPYWITCGNDESVEDSIFSSGSLPLQEQSSRQQSHFSTDRSLQIQSPSSSSSYTPKLDNSHFSSQNSNIPPTFPKLQTHPAVCPDYWAIPVNALNCKIVYNGYEPEIDLSIGKYYERIVRGKVMEKLLAIAGIRIAAVLNTLFG